MAGAGSAEGLGVGQQWGRDILGRQLWREPVQRPGHAHGRVVPAHGASHSGAYAPLVL